MDGGGGLVSVAVGGRDRDGTIVVAGRCRPDSQRCERAFSVLTGPDASLPSRARPHAASANRRSEPPPRRAPAGSRRSPEPPCAAPEPSLAPSAMTAMQSIRSARRGARARQVGSLSCRSATSGRRGQGAGGQYRAIDLGGAWFHDRARRQPSDHPAVRRKRSIDALAGVRRSGDGSRGGRDPRVSPLNSDGAGGSVAAPLPLSGGSPRGQ